VLDAARTAKNGAPVAVVYASSAAVYGDNPAVLLVKSAEKRPLTAYGADKLGCEQHAQVAGNVHNVPTMGFRFFNIYGPRQDPGSPYSGVISIFADRLSAGQIATLHGDGGQRRDFVYVGDCVRFVIAGMEKASIAAEVFNVCTGTPSSLLDLIAALSDAGGRELIVEHGPAQVGDIRDSFGDVAKTTSAFSMTVETSLRDGRAFNTGAVLNSDRRDRSTPPYPVIELPSHRG